MQKWTAFMFAVVAIAAVAVMLDQRPGRHRAHPAASTSASAQAPQDAGPPSDAGPTDAGARPDGGEPANAGTDEPPSPIESPFGMGSAAGATLLDGTTPPALPADAPKVVRFGVILVQYKGAQGALGVTRTREEALEKAKKIAADAKTDFKAAVGQGDKGSEADMGRMPRGMIEPAPEFVLFSLPKDGVSDPVDTPRGFWIVHRIE